ncbi:hypothetical protein LEMLEM_LOCUS5529 [Lemmus lemmus]
MGEGGQASVCCGWLHPLWALSSIAPKTHKREQSPSTDRSHSPSLSSACAITTCGQRSGRRRCGGCRHPRAFGASSSGLKYCDLARLPEGLGSARPPRGGAHARRLGDREWLKRRGLLRASPRLGRPFPGSGDPSPPRRPPPPVVFSPAALAAVAGSGSPASAQVGSSGGRQPGEPARPGRRSAALCSSAKRLTPAQSGLARLAASGTPNPAVPLGERRPAFCAWAALLFPGHPFENPPPRVTACDLAYAHVHPPQRACRGPRARVRLLLPSPQLCLWPGAPPPSYAIPGGSVPLQGSLIQRQRNFN